MSEQYRCNKCGYILKMKDVMCSECGTGYFEHLRWTKGGDGSHWEGCEDVHWDCRIAQLEKEIARRDEQIETLEDKLHKIADWCKAFEFADEPTSQEWEAAHKTMSENGFSLTGFVISGMRKVTTGIAEIANLREGEK